VHDVRSRIAYIKTEFSDTLFKLKICNVWRLYGFEAREYRIKL
jgi:hypothetical protein